MKKKLLCSAFLVYLILVRISEILQEDAQLLNAIKEYTLKSNHAWRRIIIVEYESNNNGNVSSVVIWLLWPTILKRAYYKPLYVRYSSIYRPNSEKQLQQKGKTQQVCSPYYTYKR